MTFRVEGRLALVADDDVSMRMLARGALEQIGLRVIEAENGQMAVDQVVTHSPDIAFLDVGMPVLHGIEVCKLIRNLKGDRLPVVMVTALDDYTSVEAAYEAGATDFVTKPVNWQLFQYRTRYLLRAADAFARVGVETVLSGAATRL